MAALGEGVTILSPPPCRAPARSWLKQLAAPRSILSHRQHTEISTRGAPRKESGNKIVIFVIKIALIQIFLTMRGNVSYKMANQIHVSSLKIGIFRQIVPPPFFDEMMKATRAALRMFV